MAMLRGMAMSRTAEPATAARPNRHEYRDQEADGDGNRAALTKASHHPGRDGPMTSRPPAQETPQAFACSAGISRVPPHKSSQDGDDDDGRADQGR